MYRIRYNAGPVAEASRLLLPDGHRLGTGARLVIEPAQGGSQDDWNGHRIRSIQMADRAAASRSPRRGYLGGPVKTGESNSAGALRRRWKGDSAAPWIHQED